MLLDVFLLRQDYEHVNTVFKPWCGMITFLSFIQRSKSDSRNINYHLLLVQQSKIDSRIIIIHSLIIIIHFIIHSRIIIIHSTVMLLIREQQSLNRIFIIVIARVTVPVYFIHSYPVYSLFYSFLTIDLNIPIIKEY